MIIKAGTILRNTIREVNRATHAESSAPHGLIANGDFKREDTHLKVHVEINETPYYDEVYVQIVSHDPVSGDHELAEFTFELTKDAIPVIESTVATAITKFL
jgi:hypothetical protein